MKKKSWQWAWGALAVAVVPILGVIDWLTGYELNVARKRLDRFASVTIVSHYENGTRHHAEEAGHADPRGYA